jgi:hypothetical protein
MGRDGQGLPRQRRKCLVFYSEECADRSSTPSMLRTLAKAEWR